MAIKNYFIRSVILNFCLVLGCDAQELVFQNEQVCGLSNFGDGLTVELAELSEISGINSLVITLLESDIRSRKESLADLVSAGFKLEMYKDYTHSLAQSGQMVTANCFLEKYQSGSKLFRYIKKGHGVEQTGYVMIDKTNEPVAYSIYSVKAI